MSRSNPQSNLGQTTKLGINPPFFGSLFGQVYKTMCTPSPITVRGGSVIQPRVCWPTSKV